jgi:IS4 transposase
MNIDRGYCDYAWFDRLTKAGCPFVTRSKYNMRYEPVKDRPLVPGSGVVADQNIRLTGVQGKKHPRQLRRIHYIDPVTQKDLVFITNNLTWSAATIAAIYKERWQIELFFKWIKQRAKIKRFVGNSMNAVMTQIWIAMIAYLITAFLKLSRKLDLTLTQIFRLIRATLFDHRDLWGVVIQADIPSPSSYDLQLELKLA